MPRKPAHSQKPPPERITYFDRTKQPLQCLAFLLPLLVGYELAMWRAYPAADGHNPGLAAPKMVRAFFSLFGATGYYLPGLVLVAILLGWHVVSRRRWTVDGRAAWVMGAESILWGMPLLFISDFIQTRPIAAGAGWRDATDHLILSIGAGIYEETVFRLILISVVTFLVVEVFKRPQSWGMAIAVIVSSLAFAAHHYEPIGTDVFHRASFIFRTLAGGYLASIFLYRGIGVAVGAHAAYNIMVVALGGV